MLWLASEPDVFKSADFIHARNLMVQYSGLVAMVWMSVAMVLAARPRWPEQWFGGLDKMYRLHKWLGVGVLAMTIFHWFWSNAPKWASAWGLIERGPHGPHPVLANPIAQWLSTFRGSAEFVGEWTFYATTALIVVALVKWFPYRLFYKTHRFLAPAYLALVLHTVVLTKFSYWITPVGLLLIALLLVGAWAAVMILVGHVGADRQVRGRIASKRFFPSIRTLEVAIDVAEGWKGHKPGQFAFVTSDTSEGAHPYTIASAWNAGDKRITFVVKALGDHTGRLRGRLGVGQEVEIEGPYGCFTFEDTCPEQIWVGGGIGITPFIARMKHLAAQHPRPAQIINLFHATAEQNEEALAKLAADAEAAGVRLHVLIDQRDGFLDGDRIRAAVSDWRRASIWFCGPTGLGQALSRDFGAAGMVLERQFHHELFAMR
nr:ferric reductase-like transmembrane domain-containing protein [Rhodoblastus sphagnicola]